MIKKVKYKSQNVVDVFDFDYTVYDGDVSLGFYFYSLRKHPFLLRYLPIQSWHAFLYLASIHTRTRFKEGFFVFLRGLKDVDREVEEFWRINDVNIKAWYIARVHSQDVIISASPEFIITPMAKKIGIRKLIATKMEKTTGSINGKNCRGPEKVRRLKDELGNPLVDKCYTDSLADLPLLELAKEKYIVKKQQIISYDQYKPSRIKERFLRKSFLTFIFVGVLNALIGLSFAFIMSIFLHNKTAAFMAGYCLGLIPSYFLNSTMTFHNRNYKVVAFIKYCISYIPNFFIQTLCVVILIEILSVNTIVAYVTAVTVGVPVTFLMVSIFAIKTREVE